MSICEDCCTTILDFDLCSGCFCGGIIRCCKLRFILRFTCGRFRLCLRCVELHRRLAHLVAYFLTIHDGRKIFPGVLPAVRIGQCSFLQLGLTVFTDLNQFYCQISRADTVEVILIIPDLLNRDLCFHRNMCIRDHISAASLTASADDCAVLSAFVRIGDCIYSNLCVTCRNTYFLHSVCNFFSILILRKVREIVAPSISIIQRSRFNRFTICIQSIFPVGKKLHFNVFRSQAV